MNDRPPGHRSDGLELRQLRQFVAVAEELNFTRAAARLHIAQQGLSASIRGLERQLGAALFIRTTRRVGLTAAGEALLPAARAVIDAAEDAVERVRQVTEGRTGRLTIGFSTGAGGVPIVREIIRRFAESAPHVDIRTAERDFSDPSAGLADDAVDIAVIFGPVPIPGLSSVTLLEEPLLLAVRPEHELAARDQVSAEEIASLPWLRVPAAAGPWVDFWFPSRPGSPVGPVIRTADEWVTAVESGRGCAFTMPSVMEDFATARVRTVLVGDSPLAAILLAWPSGDAAPLVRAFVAASIAAVPKGNDAGTHSSRRVDAGRGPVRSR